MKDEKPGINKLFSNLSASLSLSLYIYIYTHTHTHTHTHIYIYIYIICVLNIFFENVRSVCMCKRNVASILLNPHR